VMKGGEGGGGGAIPEVNREHMVNYESDSSEESFDLAAGL